MARHKSYDYGQTTMIAVDLEKQLVEGSIEYVIHKLVEERVDIRLFEKKIKNDIQKGSSSRRAFLFIVFYFLSATCRATDLCILYFRAGTFSIN